MGYGCGEIIWQSVKVTRPGILCHVYTCSWFTLGPSFPDNTLCPFGFVVLITFQKKLVYYRLVTHGTGTKPAAQPLWPTINAFLPTVHVKQLQLAFFSPTKA